MKHISDGELLYNTLPKFLKQDVVIVYIDPAFLDTALSKRLRVMAEEALGYEWRDAELFSQGMEIAISHADFVQLTQALEGVGVALNSVVYVAEG